MFIMYAFFDDNVYGFQSCTKYTFTQMSKCEQTLEIMWMHSVLKNKNTIEQTHVILWCTNITHTGSILADIESMLSVASIWRWLIVYGFLEHTHRR